MRTLLVTTLLIGAISANAQVYSCTNAANQQVFSDVPCDAAGNTGKQIQRARTVDEIRQEREMAADAEDRKFRRREAEREQQAFDQQMQTARQRQAIQSMPAPQRQSDTAECKKAQKDLEFVSSIRTISQDEKRMRTNAAIGNVNAACGTNTPLLQEPPRTVRRPFVTHCDSVHCYDNQGSVFNDAGPDLKVGPNGRTCHREGNMWNCN